MSSWSVAGGFISLGMAKLNLSLKKQGVGGKEEKKLTLLCRSLNVTSGLMPWNLPCKAYRFCLLCLLLAGQNLGSALGGLRFSAIITLLCSDFQRASGFDLQLVIIGATSKDCLGLFAVNLFVLQDAQACN